MFDAFSKGFPRGTYSRLFLFLGSSFLSFFLGADNTNTSLFPCGAVTSSSFFDEEESVKNETSLTRDYKCEEGNEESMRISLC